MILHIFDSKTVSAASVKSNKNNQDWHRLIVIKHTPAAVIKSNNNNASMCFIHLTIVTRNKAPTTIIKTNLKQLIKRVIRQVIISSINKVINQSII